MDELAARLDLRREQVLEGLEASTVYSAVSLDGLQGVEPADENDTRTNDVLDRQVLAALLERLPKRERHILYLRYFHELSQAQIAERVGTSQVHVGRLIAASLDVVAGIGRAGRTRDGRPPGGRRPSGGDGRERVRMDHVTSGRASCGVRRPSARSPTSVASPGRFRTT